ncbi:Uncharacterized protein Adt_27182 [Abeliophyllum distichum]|uniref:Uncharacterized protein n=1 Tax=Abeliophyllum distichum TaxID=126358 RepID=A0ABD1RT03_9LAMI
MYIYTPLKPQQNPTHFSLHFLVSSILSPSLLHILGQIQIGMALRTIFMLVTIMATISAAMAQDEFGMAPAPSPDHGAGHSLPVSAAVVGSSLVLCLLALIKN